MVIRFGPAPLFPATAELAVARLIEAPGAVAPWSPNGEECEIWTALGEIVARGLETYAKDELVERFEASVPAVPPRQSADGNRGRYCYEVDGSARCDDSICRL